MKKEKALELILNSIVGGIALGVGFGMSKALMSKFDNRTIATGKSELIGGMSKKDIQRGACFDSATGTYVDCSTVTKKKENKKWWE